MRSRVLGGASALLLLGACASPSASPSATAVLAKPPTGRIAVEGGKVWYQVCGKGTRTPLLVLHGGPGIPHDYLDNLAQLGDERPVIFYDQLGCGRSDRPDDPSLWTPERFSRELARVREVLGLKEVVLYGHSWGSILAVEYLTGAGGVDPAGVRGAILAGPALSMKRWVQDAQRLIDGLPAETAAAIREGEQTGATDSDAYQAATQVFYQHYVCRCDPWPQDVQDAMASMGEQVYLTLNGPSEFSVTGPIKSIDLTPRLSTLTLPLLFICGQYDEATPESTRYYASLAPKAQVVVVPDASHLANYDQPERYMSALRGWLDGNGL